MGLVERKYDRKPRKQAKGNRMNYYAHSLENQSTEKWQELEEHLEKVGEISIYHSLKECRA